MPRPICDACTEGKPCTGWAWAVTADGTVYEGRCAGRGKVMVSGSWVADKKHEDDGGES